MNLQINPKISATFIIIFIIMLIWSIIWKGISLYKAGKNKDKIWFIILLIINTFGILEILYIFIFSKNDKLKKK